MIDSPSPIAANEDIAALKKEIRRKSLGAIASGIIAGVVAATVGIWSYVKTLPGTVGLVPKGAVVAFWSEPNAKPKEVCKDGWSPLREGVGRVIVGAGDTDASWQAYVDGSTTPNGKRQPFTERKPQAVGGEEMHALSVGELAEHNHTSDGGFDALLKQGGAWTVHVPDSGGAPEPTLESSGKIKVAGGNLSHNTMPPFIALYYCSKD